MNQNPFTLLDVTTVTNLLDGLNQYLDAIRSTLDLPLDDRCIPINRILFDSYCQLVAIQNACNDVLNSQNNN